MLNIVLFGPPGAGKGTQANFLKDTFNLVHISTGDVFRKNIKNQTPLGILAQSYMDKGALVPDQVTIDMLSDEVSKNSIARGFIFDGFPRTKDQAIALDKFLNLNGTQVTTMIALNVPEKELINRLLERGKDSGRADDQDEAIIANRIEVYEQNTAVLASFYEDQNKLSNVNGLGSIDEITSRIYAAIDKK